MTLTSSPVWTVRSTPVSAVTPPKVRLNSRTSSSAGGRSEPVGAKMLGCPRKAFTYFSFKTWTLSLPGTKNLLKGV